MTKSYVVNVKVVDIQRKRLSDKQRHYVYGLRVTWSDSAVFCIYRKYSMFFEFQVKLYEMFPYTQDSGIPAIPAKIFGRVQILSPEKRAKKIENFCQALIKLPALISQCDDVLGFFEAWPEDMELKLNKGDLKTNPFYASTPPNDDFGDPLYQDVQGDVEVEHELEVYRAIAPFLGRGPNEVPFEMGVIVHVIDKNENGWWLVQVGEKEGRAPGSYLEPVEPQQQQRHLDNIPEEVPVEYYKAVADYQPEDQDELVLREGDEVWVLEKNFDGWWKVKCEGKIGYAPSTYLRRGSRKAEQLQRDVEDIYALPMKPPPRRGSAEKQEKSSGRGMFEVKRSITTDDGGYVVMGQEQRRSSGGGVNTGEVFDSRRPPGEQDIKKKPQLQRRQHDSCTSLERNVHIMSCDFSEPGGILIRKGEPVQIGKHDEAGWSYVLRLRPASPGHTGEGWVPTNQLQREDATSPSGGPPSLSFSLNEEDAAASGGGSVFVAIDNYVSKDPDASMSFNKGEKVTVIEKKESGWWFVRIDDCEGWVPGSFFEPVVSPVVKTPGVLVQKRFTAPSADDGDVDSPLPLTAPSDPALGRDDNLLKPSKSLTSHRATSSPQLQSNPRPSPRPPLSPRMSRRPQPDQDKFELSNQVWYHGSLSRPDAEALLLNYGRDREFLVRESPNRVGNYAISILFENRVRHFPVETRDGKLYFGQHYYDKMSGIVKYYQSYPLFFIETIGITLGLPVRSGRT